MHIQLIQNTGKGKLVFMPETTDVLHQLILYVSSLYTYCLFLLLLFIY